MSRRKVIWLTIIGIMLFAAWHDRLTFGTFCLLWFVAAMLSKIFDPEEKPAKVATEDKPEPDEYVESSSSDDVIRIRRRSVELLRNSLMRHHNSRGTDKEYQASATAKETTEILQALNAALAKKPRRLAQTA